MIKQLSGSILAGIVVGLFMLMAQLWTLPRLERNKLIKQERWKAKKDAFAVAIKLIDRHFSATSWLGPQVPKDFIPSKDKPTSNEINNALAQLLLISDNNGIPKRFIKFFAKGNVSSPGSRGEFILLLREELFETKSDLKPEEVPYFF